MRSYLYFNSARRYSISWVWFTKASVNIAIIDSDIGFPSVWSQASIWTSICLLVLVYGQLGHLVSNFIEIWLNIQYITCTKTNVKILSVKSCYLASVPLYHTITPSLISSQPWQIYSHSRLCYKQAEGYAQKPAKGPVRFLLIDWIWFQT